MVDGWPEILNDCISTKAYPTVLVYEAWKPDYPRLDKVEIPTENIREMVELADQKEDDFSEEDINEQIRLFQLYELRKTNS